MTRRPKPVPFGASDLTTGELRRAPRSRRWLTTTVVIALLVVIAAASYAVTFAPDQYATWKAHKLSGEETVEVASGVEVTPAASWIVQPRVTDLVEWSPLPPLRDWQVLTGSAPGVELLSPDRRLSVELWEAGGSAADLGDGEVRSEQLASGAELKHVDGPHEIRAVVTLGDHEVQVLARLLAAADSTAADAATAADSAADVGGGDGGGGAGGGGGGAGGGDGSGGAGASNAAKADSVPAIDEYRPALSALLESLSVGEKG